MCDFVHLLLKLNIFFFHQGLKNLDIQKMIYHHFLLNLLKIKIFCLFVYGGIVVKMDNLDLLEKVLIFLFHT
jgi:hypothetical protein